MARSEEQFSCRLAPSMTGPSLPVILTPKTIEMIANTLRTFRGGASGATLTCDVNGRVDNEVREHSKESFSL